MIAIVDYGVGNIFSLKCSLAALGEDVVLTADPQTLASADGIILPGVGAFEDARAKLAVGGLDGLVVRLAGEGKPLLGICLGMQMLFDESLEFGVHEGLGLIPGRVVSMRGVIPEDFAIPQIGWNALAYTENGPGRLLDTTPEGAYVYFVHSFYASECDADTTATCDYGVPLTAVVERGNVFGCQFHPEKSGHVGLEILRRFCEIAKETAGQTTKTSETGNQGMLIFPAIDIIGGKVVRLTKGDYAQVTVYGDSPLEVARAFEAAGATCIHMVDLEGAKTGATPNLEAILAVARETSLFCEVGGGVRSMDVVRAYLDGGVDRVIIGTAAVKDPAFLAAAVAEYDDRIAVGVDLRDGCVAIHGWTEVSDLDGVGFCRSLERAGVATVIVTDISKDGVLAGCNVELYRTLSEACGLRIVASGGVSSLEDVKALAGLGLYAAIIGKAYYEGKINLSEAIEAACGRPSSALPLTARSASAPIRGAAESGAPQTTLSGQGVRSC